MLTRTQIDHHLKIAIKHFWRTRRQQVTKQSSTGRTDQGARSAVTGGKQMDEFVKIVRGIVQLAGIPSDCIFTDSRLELPGYYRPEKKWDLVVVRNSTLIAAIEIKSLIGPSFGNNFNNRSEEAIGIAQDIWTAFREGAFPTSTRPWLGFIMLLEDCEKSNRAVKYQQPHFPVFPDFQDTSYSARYQILLRKLLRERLFDSACFIMSKVDGSRDGSYSEPDPSLAFHSFANQLYFHINTLIKLQDEEKSP